MDNTISTARPDVVALETAPRPTAPPVRVPFSEILSSSALALVEGAQAAARSLPGAPVVAAAVRSGGLGASSLRAQTLAGSATPEGPGGGLVRRPGMLAVAGAGSLVPGGTAAGAGDGTIDASLAQSQQLNLYYLQIQQQVNDQATAPSPCSPARHRDGAQHGQIGDREHSLGVDRVRGERPTLPSSSPQGTWASPGPALGPGRACS